MGLPRGHRKGCGHRHEHRSRIGQHIVKFGKTHVVADAEAQRPPGKCRNHGLASRRKKIRFPDALAARHIHVKEVYLVVTCGHRSIRAQTVTNG